MDKRWTTDIPSRAVIFQLMAGKQIAFSLAGVARLGVADYMSEHVLESSLITTSAGRLVGLLLLKDAIRVAAELK